MLIGYSKRSWRGTGGIQAHHEDTHLLLPDHSLPYLREGKSHGALSYQLLEACKRLPQRIFRLWKGDDRGEQPVAAVLLRKDSKSSMVNMVMAFPFLTARLEQSLSILGHFGKPTKLESVSCGSELEANRPVTFQHDQFDRSWRSGHLTTAPGPVDVGGRRLREVIVDDLSKQT